MHEHVNIHILLSLLWGYVHTVMCEKCLVRIEGSLLLQVASTGPLKCVAHFELHKKCLTVFLCVCVYING